MTTDRSLKERLEQLRRSFDEVFARPAVVANRDAQDFLIVRPSEAEAYAIRVSEITGIVRDRKIVALPTRSGACLGLAGVRGRTVPVYDLAERLGHAPAGREARWMILAAGTPEIALAFSEVVEYLRVAQADLVPVGPDAAPRKHVRQALQSPAGMRLVVSLSSVVGELRVQRRDNP